MKRYISFAIFILFSLSLSAQTEPERSFATGLIMDDADYTKQPREPRFTGSKYTELPAKVDLTPYCPEVGNQGEIQSCVGWALGYGAMTIQRAIQNQMTDKQAITENANSALFIYNQVKQNDNCGSGARISDAVSLLMETGDCLSDNFDGNVNDCSTAPSPALQQEAANYTVADFMTLFATNETPELKVLKIKKALANQQPVVIGLDIYRNFFTLKNITYWRPEIGSQIPAGGHAMVVVGYNELRGAFHIMNSWGKEWGKDGFIWVKYKEFGKFCKYAYTLHLGEAEEGIRVKSNVEADIQSMNEPTQATAKVTTNSTTTNSAMVSTDNLNTPRLAGSFKFLYVDNEAYGDEPLIRPADVTFNGNYYRVTRTDWEIGQFFQLLAKSASKNDYIYVFSVDMTGDVNIHWPRSEALNSHFEGINESAFVNNVNSEIYIPGRDKGLIIEKKGTDHLCILYSKKPLSNIKAISEYMQDQKGQFYQSLTELLKDYIIPKDQIQFSSDNIDFVTNSSQGFIVPIVLELETK